MKGRVASLFALWLLASLKVSAANAIITVLATVQRWQKLLFSNQRAESKKAHEIVCGSTDFKLTIDFKDRPHSFPSLVTLVSFAVLHF